MTIKLNKRRAIEIIKVLEGEGFPSMLAGGCVRDHLLNRIAKDYDIATTALPDQVLNIAKRLLAKWKRVPTGIDHGTVTIVTDAGPIEITTLRKDVETDGRHAVVEFAGASFADDAARRDFTVNAMYENSEGEVVDLVGGLADIESMQLRFVGDARQRIKEDYLRIMRLYRFWSTYGLLPNQDARLGAQELCSGLRQVSQERITNELLQMIAGEHISTVLSHMVTDDVIKCILPQLNDRKILAYGPQLGKLRWDDPHYNKLGRLAFLVISCLEPSDNWQAAADLMAELKLSRLHQRCVGELAKKSYRTLGVNPSQAAMMNLIDHCEMCAGKGSFTALFLPVWGALAHATTSGEEHPLIAKLGDCEFYKSSLRLAHLPLSAHDVMAACGLQPGPELGAVLEKLKEAYRNEVWRTRDEGIKFLGKTDD